MQARTIVFRVRLISLGITLAAATVMAITLSCFPRVRITPPPADASERALAAAQSAAVREVAEQLGNTPAVCRGSYIHPVVFEAWRDGRLARCIGPEDLRGARKLEAAALRFLARASRPPSRARRAPRGRPACAPELKRIARRGKAAPAPEAREVRRQKKGPPVARTVLPFPQSYRPQILNVTPVEDLTLPALS